MDLNITKAAGIWNGIVLVGQFGLSLIMPLLICLGACYLITDRTGAGGWIYIPGFILGLGGGFSTAYGFYRAAMKKNARRKDQKGRTENEFSVSRHL